ncbi:MAG: hypothetical protein HOP15_16940 [Planctomycetes bacterium]|nr:hypothetical protein [Planctomycetota bacterium]
MSPYRSHGVLLLGLALSGCASPAQDLGHLVWPDQFHFTYETSDGELDGRAGRALDTQRDALLFGLSWDISPRNQGLSREDLRWLILELRREAAPKSVQAFETSTTDASAPIVVLPPEPVPIEVVAEELPPEPVPEEPAPVEVVTEVVEEVAPEALPKPPPLAMEEVVAEAVGPAVQAEVAQEEPAAPAPIVDAEGRRLYGVVLVSALGVLLVALAIRFLPSLRTAR